MGCSPAATWVMLPSAARSVALLSARVFSPPSSNWLLAGATGLAFFVYVLVNGGMIAGVLPVVGVPMPLISYGGTAAVSLLAGFGLVMSVRRHNPVHGGYD